MCVHLTATLCAFVAVGSVPAASAQNPLGKQTYPETIRIAEHLATLQPRTTWEVATEGEAADLIEFISNDRVLVGVMDVNKNAAPSYGKVYLIDASTGTVLWDYERDGSDGSYSLIATRPVLLLMHAGPESIELTALDAESGKKVWDVKRDAPYGVAMAPDRELLLVVYRDGDDRKVRGVDMGSGDERWELTYIDNVVEANLKALEAPAAPGNVYNVAAGDKTTVNQLLAMMCRAMKTSAEPIFKPARNGDVRDSLADISRVRHDLGYEPTVSVSEGLDRTITWATAQSS